jgi:Lipocalin-like domain
MLDLVGTWKLVSWRRIVDDERVTYPLGENAQGLLVYTQDGAMAVTMIASNRPTMPDNDPLGGEVGQRAEAYSTCMAYMGTYELRDDEVVHRIDVSLYPNWAGDEQVRRFTCAGNTLVLRTPPVHGASGTVVNELAWARQPRTERG